MGCFPYLLFMLFPSVGFSKRQEYRAFHDFAHDDIDCADTPKTILFVRHGESINNIVSQSAREAMLRGNIGELTTSLRRYRRSVDFLKEKGWATIRDSPLSKRGASYMGKVGDMLFKDGNTSRDKFDIFSNFKKIFVSPLRRTQGTAFMIFGRAARDAHIPFVAQPWAHEQRKSQSDTGEKTSVLIDFALKFAEHLDINQSGEPVNSLVESLNSLPENWSTDSTQPTEDLPYYPPDEFDADAIDKLGEATRETEGYLADRMDKLMEEMCRDSAPQMILVTHSAVLRTLLPQLFNLEIKPANGGMFVASLQRKDGLVTLSNPMTASKFFQTTLKLPSLPDLPDYHRRRRRRNKDIVKPVERKRLRVTIVSASGLHNTDWIGKSNPYCTVAFEGGKEIGGKTKVIDSDLNPVWNETFDLEDYIVGKNLVFKLWDENWLKFDDPLGDLTLASDRFLPNGSGEQALELPLDNAGKSMNASLKVKVDVPPQNTPFGISSISTSTGTMREDVSTSLEKIELQVTIIAASGLENRDWFGKSDPYCTVAVEGAKGVQGQTSVIDNDLNPVWNETFELEDYYVGKNLVFKVWDKDWFKSDDPLGEVTLASDKFMPNGSGEQALELPLENVGNGIKASLKVKVRPLPKFGASSSAVSSRFGVASLGFEGDRYGSIRSSAESSRFGVAGLGFEGDRYGLISQP